MYHEWQTGEKSSSQALVPLEGYPCLCWDWPSHFHPFLSKAALLGRAKLPYGMFKISPNKSKLSSPFLQAAFSIYVYNTVYWLLSTSGPGTKDSRYPTQDAGSLLSASLTLNVRKYIFLLMRSCLYGILWK